MTKPCFLPSIIKPALRGICRLSLLFAALFLCSLSPLSASLAAAAEDGSTSPVKPPKQDIPAIPTIVTETPAQALWTWQRSRHRQARLILLSNDPFLFPVPKEQLSSTRTFLATTDHETFLQRTRGPVANPLILPPMAVDLVLHSGLFKQVIWIFPIHPKAQALNLDLFLEQMQSSASLTPEEAKTFHRQGDCFAGMARNVPLSACPISGLLPDLSGPSLLHIDLSFFSHAYQNEIKTPLYDLVYGTLSLIYSAGIESSKATISASNTTGDIALRTRFLAHDVATLLESPQKLERPRPELWRLRAQNLYLENFFQSEPVLANLQRMEQIAPKDPTVKFALYEGYRGAKQGNQALESLAKAVDLDPVYAYEYLQLAQMALNKNRPDAALEMADKAIAAQPLDPFLKLMKIQLMMKVGHPKKPILELIREVRDLQWSKTYDPQIKTELDTLLQTLAIPQS